MGNEPCYYCGRFQKQVWFLASDEPNDWQDYWECSQVAQHMTAHPLDFGHAPKEASNE